MTSVRRIGILNTAAAAATTLPWVYQRTQDPAIAEALIKLIDHPDAAIRGAAISHILLLGFGYRARAWDLLERSVTDESPHVAQRAGEVFDHLLEDDAPRAWRGRFAVYDRFAREIVNDYTVGELRRLIEWALDENEEAAARVDAVLDDPWAQPELAKLMAFAMTTRLGPPTANASAVVPRLVRFVNNLSDQLLTVVSALGNDVSTYSERDRDRTNTSLNLLAEIARRVQVHSGLTSDAPLFDDERSRFLHYQALLPVLDALADAPIPHAAYYVVRTLSDVLEVDPVGILALGTRAILTGARVGLAMDQFGQADVRDFLLRYLNGHRELLESDRIALKGFMDVVDAFAAVGWPAWIEVTFALDAIYRE